MQNILKISFQYQKSDIITAVIEYDVYYWFEKTNSASWIQIIRLIWIK